MSVIAVAEPVITLNPTVQSLLAVSLAFIMLTVALGLKTNDFTFIRTNPLSVIVGMAAQLIGLPLLTLGLTTWLTPDPQIALGMMVVACCPGGNMSNLLTRLAHGDTAYSVSLTMLSSIFAVSVLPFAILFWTGLYGPTSVLLDEINIDRQHFIITTTLTLMLPLMAGLWLAHAKPETALRLNKAFMPFAVGILILVIIAGLAGNFDLFLDYGAKVMPLVILHNSLAFILGGMVGILFLKHAKRTRTLSFEVGIQNSGLGLLIILTQMGSVSGAAIIVGAWGVWHLIAGFALVGTLRLIDTLTLQKIENKHGI